MKTLKTSIRRIFDIFTRQNDDKSHGGLSAAAIQDLRIWMATFDHKTDNVRTLNMRPAMSVSWIVKYGHPVVTHAYLTRDEDGFVAYFPQEENNGNAIDLENARRMLESLRPTSSGYVVVRGTEDAPSNREILAYEIVRHKIETTHGLH